MWPGSEKERAQAKEKERKRSSLEDVSRSMCRRDTININNASRFLARSRMRKIDVSISVAVERSSIISRIRVDMIHARHFIIAKEAKMYLSISNIKDLFLFHIKFCFKSNLILMKHESLHFFRKKIKKLSDEEIYYILYFVGINKN